LHNGAVVHFVHEREFYGRRFVVLTHQQTSQGGTRLRCEFAEFPSIDAAKGFALMHRSTGAWSEE
jgi:hypothetical protein